MKSIRKVLLLMIVNLILALHCSILPVYATAAAGENIAKNFGFEQGQAGVASNWNPDVWDKNIEVTTISWDSTQKHTGSKSISINNSKPNDARCTQTIKVDSDSFYRISCYIKTENVGMDAKGANISVKGITATSEDVKGSSGWEKIEMFGRTGKDQSECTLTLGLGGYGSLNMGKAWFDDVEVEKIDELPQGATVIDMFVNAGASSSGGNGTSAYFLPITLFMILVGTMVLIYILGKRSKPQQMDYSIRDYESVIPQQKAMLEKKDFLVMAVMTVIYLCVALYQLGSLKAPQTSWTSTAAGDSFVLDAGKTSEIDRLYYFQGLGEGNITLEYENEAGKFVSIGNSELKDCFRWNFIYIGKKTSKLKVIVTKPGAMLNELVLFAKGSKNPMEGVRITDEKLGGGDIKLLAHLIDEQDTVDYKRSYMSGTYFDEIYHAKTAYENIQKIEPTETSHPPLGKLFIALGVLIFGMDPFGWRIVGTLFGALMIPILYLFARKMFSERFYAFCAAFLLMFDFMHFVQTRIATIDVYGTFFIILMYYYMYDYFMNKSYEIGLKESLKPLFLSGLFFGIGVASKWIALYGAAGLAFLFFYAKWKEYGDYKRMVHKKTRPAWVDRFMIDNIAVTFLWCVLIFIVMPVVIYGLSYIPYLMVKGANHNINDIISYQPFMYNYHKNLVAQHPFQSNWYTWPLIYKPMWYYSGADLATGMASSISAFGNPAVWWVGALAVPVSAVIALLKKDKKMLVVYIAILFQYVPWMLVSRIAFIYHFFSVVPFMILSIVYVIKHLVERIPMMKYTVFVYLCIVMILFVMFYPVLSGMEVPKEYIENYLRWFKSSWIF